MKTYSSAFYKSQVSGSVLSAKKVVPRIMELIHPDSVLEIGCGLGGWLSEFITAGCTGIGVDGDWVDKQTLLIPTSSFLSTDLCSCAREGVILGLPRGERFSLVVSCEVAEHLSPALAKPFVKLLCAYSDRIVFSAAIPHQGGTNHLNEMWQDYWVGLFGECGYDVFDLIRPLIWGEREVQPWYKQNILIFAKQPINYISAVGEALYPTSSMIRLVHPEFYLKSIDYYQSSEFLDSRSAGRLLLSLWRRLLATVDRVFLRRKLTQYLRLKRKGGES